MIRVPVGARRAGLFVPLALLASAALSACGTSVVAPTVHVTGLPSLSISVPLRVVACTPTDTCVAFGTTGQQVEPLSVGEYRRASGPWTTLAVPSIPSSSVSSSSCWPQGCLVGGADPTGDLVWWYHAAAAAVTSATAPTDGHGVQAVSCFADQSCAIVDSTGPASSPRLWFTSDAAATWGVPTPLTWASADTVTSLACTSALDCLASAVALDGPALLEVTHDGGTTWTQRSTPTSWTGVSSLSCHARRCSALAATTTNRKFVTSDDFGHHWSTYETTGTPAGVACTTAGHCVVVGQIGSQRPWLATLRAGSLVAGALTYVPSPLTNVACGTHVCAAIAVSTVTQLRP